MYRSPNNTNNSVSDESPLKDEHALSMNKALLTIAQKEEDNERIGFMEFKSINFDYGVPRFILDVIHYLSGVKMFGYDPGYDTIKNKNFMRMNLDLMA